MLGAPGIPRALAGRSRTGTAAEPPTPFIDRFQKMPVHDGVESDVWGRSFVVPRDTDNGMEDPEWCYWGGDVVKGPDGRYHMFVARWPESTGHDGWGHASRIARCVADDPTGPFAFREDIVGDTYGHNPAVIEVDGTFAVFNHRSYDLALADAPSGPWETVDLDIEGLDSWTNPAPVARDDGSILVVNRTPHHIYVADTLTGPYRRVATDWAPDRFVDVEDQAIWREDGLFHLIANQWSRRTAFYMYSADGIDWTLPARYNAYVPGITHYEDGTETLWYKMERPKVLVEDGTATHVYFAVIDVRKADEGKNDRHSSKTIAIPLAPPGSSSPSGPISEGAYRIENVATGRAMSVAGGENEEDAPVHHAAWSNTNKQRWLVTHLGEDIYRLEATHSSDMRWQKVLSVEDASTQDGASLVQQTWTDGEGENQLWTIHENDDGTFRLENVRSGRVAEAQDGARDEAPVVQSEWTGGDRQKWTLRTPL